VATIAMTRQGPNADARRYSVERHSNKSVARGNAQNSCQGFRLRQFDAI
jgi:hypothetical protein